MSNIQTLREAAAVGKTLDQMEQEYILEMLALCQFKWKTAAERLGVSDSGLRKKVKKYTWKPCEVKIDLEKFFKKRTEKSSC